MKRSTKILLALAVVTTILFGVYFKLIFMERDLTGPEISGAENPITASVQSINASDEDLLVGITAVDEKDGDVSDTLLVESIKHLEGKDCLVTFAASDKANNVSKGTRRVTFEDYEPIKIKIEDRLLFPLGTKSQAVLKLFTAYDCIDGDITGKLRFVNGNYDTSIAGIATYDVTAANSIGDSVVIPVAVEFYSDTIENKYYSPRIYLTDYLVYLKQGEEFHPKKYLDHLGLGNNYYVFSSSSGSKIIDGSVEEGLKATTEDGTLISGTIHLSAIDTSSNVNTSKPGTYTVTFSCKTANGYFGSVQMIVIVTE